MEAGRHVESAVGRSSGLCSGSSGGRRDHCEAAERFGVNAPGLSQWRKRERDHGDQRPNRLGCDRRSNRIEAHHELVMAALRPYKDATIAQVRASPATHCLIFGFGTIQRFLAHHAITRTKDRARNRAEPP
jgi:hypothetical protein